MVFCRLAALLRYTVNLFCGTLRMNDVPIFKVMALVCAGVGALALGYNASAMGAAGAFIGAGLFAIADSIRVNK